MKTLAKEVAVSMAANRNTLCCAPSRTDARSRVSMLRMLLKEQGLGPPTTLRDPGGFCAAQIVQRNPSSFGGTLHPQDGLVTHEGGLGPHEPYGHLRTHTEHPATVAHEAALLLEVAKSEAPLRASVVRRVATTPTSRSQNI